MTTAVLIAALIGCGLISLAIRARLLSKRKSQPLPVSNASRKAPADSAPAASAIQVPIGGGPIEDGVPSRQIAENLIAAADTAISGAGAQTAKIVDSTDFNSAARSNAANTVGYELDPAPVASFEAAGAVPAALLLGEDSPAPIIHAFKQEPGPASRSEAECAAPQAAEIAASRSKFTATPASIYLADAPAADKPDSRLQENSEADEDAQNAAEAPNAELIKTSDAGFPKEPAEMPQAGETAGYELDPSPVADLKAAGAVPAAPPLGEDSPASIIHAFKQEPGPSSRSEAECASPVASEIAASRVKLTASPASVYLAVARAPDAPDPRLQESSAAPNDAQHAAAALDAELIKTSGAGFRKAPEELPQTGVNTAAIALEPHLISALPGSETASGWPDEIASTVPVYRPPVLTAAKSRTSESARSSPSIRVLRSSLAVRLQLLPSRTGDVHIGLQFKRPEGFPPSLAIKVRGKDVQLNAYGDGWYMADAPNQFSLTDALKEGLIASGRVNSNARTSWMLSAGRELYVAAPQPGAAGYMQVPRLTLGCAQIVVAREHLQDQAMEILAESCGKTVQRLAAGSAILPGWAVLGPVTPLKPVSHRDGDERLNVIRPLAELAILLEGGLSLTGVEWLEGFPPRIAVAGPIPESERVLIDNDAASADPTGAYRTPGCDSVGDHTVWCAGTSRTYKISPGPQQWEPWSAHAQRKGTVCGASSEYQAKSPGAQLTTVPSSNRVLIGAEPGQLHVCSGQGEEWTGIVPFAPVWALPANPFQCRKNVVRVMLLTAKPIRLPARSGSKRLLVRAWCAAILDCKRKGLELETPGTASLWAVYTREARTIWRSIR